MLALVISIIVGSIVVCAAVAVGVLTYYGIIDKSMFGIKSQPQPDNEDKEEEDIAPKTFTVTLLTGRPIDNYVGKYAVLSNIKTGFLDNENIDTDLDGITNIWAHDASDGSLRYLIRHKVGDVYKFSFANAKGREYVTTVDSVDYVDVRKYAGEWVQVIGEPVVNTFSIA